MQPLNLKAGQGDRSRVSLILTPTTLSFESKGYRDDGDKVLKIDSKLNVIRPTFLFFSSLSFSLATKQTEIC